MLNRILASFFLTIAVISVSVTESCADSRPRLRFGLVTHGSNVVVAYTEYLKQVYSEAGYKSQMIKLPAKRAIQEANAGRLDGIILFPEIVLKSNKNLVIVKPELATIDVMAYTLNDQRTITSITDLDNMVIGLIHGYEATERLIQGRENNIAVSGYRSLFSMLNHNRIDVALAIRRESHRFLANNLDVGKFKMHPTPIYTLHLYHFLHKKHSELAYTISSIMKHSVIRKRLNELLLLHRVNIPENVTLEIQQS